jgi:hypothetical protein
VNLNDPNAAGPEPDRFDATEPERHTIADCASHFGGTGILAGGETIDDRARADIARLRSGQRSLADDATAMRASAARFETATLAALQRGDRALADAVAAIATLDRNARGLRVAVVICGVIAGAALCVACVR